MRFKKIVSGLLASALVVTSAFAGNTATVKAEQAAGAERAAEDVTPVATYDFNSKTLKEGVEVFNKGLSSYGGTVGEGDFAAGRGGEGDFALNLDGKFGMVLPEKNIGSKYTVSMWVKRSGDMTNFMPVLFLGRGANGQWVGIAGAYGNPDNCILWGGNNPDSITSANEANFPLEKEWVMLTITQDENDMKIYKNGVLNKSITVPTKILDGEEQKIHVGVNPYEADGVFPGLVDDISVYNQALTADQVYALFDTRSEKELFEQGEMKVSESFTMYQGRSRQIQLTLPAGVSAQNLDITYTSEDPAIASVDANGKITGVAPGSTTITTKAKYDDVEKTGTTTVQVNDSTGIDVNMAADYDLTHAVDGKLIDKTGHGNDAVIKDPECVKFVSGDNGSADYASFEGDESKGYVELPSSIMESLDNPEEFTVEVKFAKTANCGNNAWLYCFGSKPQGTGTNYMFLSPNFEGKTLRAGIKDSATEKRFGTSIQPKVDEWYTVNMVFDKGKVKLYWNGILIKGDNGDELDSGYSIMKDIVEPGTENGVLGFIGKSCWSADKNFKGKISSFKIHNKVLTDQEIQSSDPVFAELFQKSMEASMTVDKVLGKNKSKDEVTYNLSLPASIDEVDVTWESLTPAVISNDGKVTCGAQDQKASLKGTAKSGTLTATVTFEFTVKPLNKSALTEIVTEANQALSDAYLTQESKAALTQAVADSEKVGNQEDVDNAVRKIRNAIRKLAYPDGYQEPFDKIDESKFKDITLAPKGTSDVLTSAVPANIKDFVEVKYESKNAAVASVDAATGKITGNKLGYAVIVTTVTAKYDKFAMEYQTLVKVDVDLTGVTAKASAATLKKGGKASITVNYPTAVKSMNPSVTYRATGAVSVNKTTGQITGKKGGTGTVFVKVSVGGKSITRTVKVNVGDIEGASTVKVKKSITLKVKGISGKVTWSLDKKGKKLATISKKGKLTAKKAGKVTVSAKVGKMTLKKTVTIKKK